MRLKKGQKELGELNKYTDKTTSSKARDSNTGKRK
jgi:hypothetical protein